MSLQAQGQGSPQSQNSSGNVHQLPNTTNLYPDIHRPPQQQRQQQQQVTPGENNPFNLPDEFVEHVENLTKQNDELTRSNRQVREGFDVLSKKVQDGDAFQKRMLAAVAPHLVQEAPDPLDSQLENIDQQMAYYLQQLATPEGKRVKMTLENKVEQLELMRSFLTSDRENKAVIKKLQDQLSYLTDPEVSVERTIYRNVENMMLQGLERLYGTTPQVEPVIKAQLQAIRQYAIDVLSEAKQHPRGKAYIKSMKNDMRLQSDFVNHCLETVIPPAIVARMKEEKVMSEPITMDQWGKAWEQARGVQDPDLRRDIMEQLRYKYYELKNPQMQRMQQRRYR